MTRAEVNQLRRQTFLAIRAFFVASLEPDWASKLDPIQMQAADMAYHAACKELDHNPAEEIPLSVRRDINNVIYELRSALKDGFAREDQLRSMRSQLESAVSADPADDQAAEGTEEGNQ